MQLMPSADEKQVCYWCNDCQQFVKPDHLHNGQNREHRVFNVKDYNETGVIERVAA